MHAERAPPASLVACIRNSGSGNPCRSKLEISPERRRRPRGHHYIVVSIALRADAASRISDAALSQSSAHGQTTQSAPGRAMQSVSVLSSNLNVLWFQSIVQFFNSENGLIGPGISWGEFDWLHGMWTIYYTSSCTDRGHNTDRVSCQRLRAQFSLRRARRAF